MNDRKCTHGLDPRSCALCEPASTEAMQQEIAELRRERDEARALLQSCARVTHGLDVTDTEREQALSVLSPLVADLANARLLLDQKRRCECSDDEACAFVRERDEAREWLGVLRCQMHTALDVADLSDDGLVAAAKNTVAMACANIQDRLDIYESMREAEQERDRLAAENVRQKDLRSREEQRTLAALADLDEVTVALRLLWDETTDESRCTVEAGHCLSLPCRDAVCAALKGDK